MIRSNDLASSLEHSITSLKIFTDLNRGSDSSILSGCRKPPEGMSMYHSCALKGWGSYKNSFLLKKVTVNKLRSLCTKEDSKNQVRL